MRIQRSVDTEKPCGTTCVACGRDRPEYALENRKVDGVDIVVCINATECHSHWPENG